MNKYPTGLKTNRFIDCLALLGLLHQDATLRAQIHNGIIYLDRPIADVATSIIAGFIPESIFTPHNKSGGFAMGSKGVSNVQHVRVIRESTCDRFAPMRDSIACIDRALSHTGYDPANPPESAKDEFVTTLLAFGDFRLKTWLDVVYAQTELGLKALPIAGKAGAEGSGEYSKSYADALFAEYGCDGEPLNHCLRDLRSLLTGSNAATHQKISPGRYIAAGGIGSQFGFGSPTPAINPWGLLLGMSGVMFFASLTHRHIAGSDSGSPVVPFSVAASQLGYASASQAEKAGCEIFFPHWDVMVTGRQLQSFFRKGRSRIDDRPAKNGLRFLTAITRWAPSAATPRFSRFLALERASDRGNAWFCCQGTYEPLTAQDAALVSQAESWVLHYCRKTQTQALADRYYGVFNGNRRMTDLAIALGKSFLHQQSSGKLCDLILPKIQLNWVERLLSENPDCPELRLALALRHYPHEQLPTHDSLRYWKINNLTKALITLNRDRAKCWSQGKVIAVPYINARCDDLAAFLMGITNDALILDFVRFLSVVQVNDAQQVKGLDLGASVHCVLPPGFRAITAVWHWCRMWRPDRVRGDLTVFPYEGQILSGLATGHSKIAIDVALRRLRQADHLPTYRLLRQGFELPIALSQRWAATLAFSPSDAAISALICPLRSAITPESTAQSTPVQLALEV